jgi:hypothetical protein
MPRIGTVRPASPTESADDMRLRAGKIRDHAWRLGSDVAVPRLLELAAELEAQADTLDAEGKPGLASVWDQVSAGWTSRDG